MRKKITSILLHLELILMSIIVLVPVIWIVMSSFNKGAGLSSATLIPKELSLENYKNLFTQTNYPVWFFNTLKIAIANTVCSVTLIMITAWIMSRFKFKGKKQAL
ncbi:hypothetical protein NSA50_07275 [Clostridium sp. DSM 100503]|uniref:hypothetical protein n=1 Tax=Clostridium sp. DSM 100503 TaxID=2963282 RepID=UPI00214A079C|nr:hypothetical protein [Clostridium sp. DSM 100503]MCR1950861.1 hypothetical protein [Clostridium sp. DSM 100503]